MIPTITIQKKKIQDLILPSNYSKELAEETGIHIGDGCMNIYRHATDAVYTYSGHAKDDYDFSIYVKKLLKSLYNLEPSYERIQKNTILLAYCRVGLIRFKHKLGLPLGPKINIKIPQWVFSKRKFKVACLSGIFATDGCLLFQKKNRNVGYYPRLSITSKSEILTNQINSIFNEFGIKSTVSCNKRILPRHPNKTWSVLIYGKKNLNKFVKIIGFSNPKHFRKHKEWEKMVPEAGYEPTTLIHAQ